MAAALLLVAVQDSRPTSLHQTLAAAPLIPARAPALVLDHPATTGVSHGAMTWDGVPRRWRLFIPPHTGSAGLPLLLLLHPAGGTVDRFVAETEMDPAATKYGFATVAPEGIDQTWNAGACCGAARDKHIDDVGFLDAMITHILRHAPIDSGQIYVAGASNGGMMAYALACQLAPRIQAVFSAGGAQTVNDCHPATPISVVEFHSLADTLVPFYGGVDPRYSPELPTFGSTQSVFRAWAASDECPVRTISDAGFGEQVEIWYGCANGTLLEVWLRISGGGHEWPAAPQAPVDATLTIARAIASHRLIRRLGPSTDPIGM